MALMDPVDATARRLGWMVGAVLAGATALVFSLGLGGEFIWDDIQLIASNAYVRDPALLGTALTHPFWHTSNAWDPPGPLSSSYYRPIVTLAYALEFRLFGEHTAGFHAVNLALHLGCVLLVFAWLRRRMATVAPPRMAVRAAGLGAALFALHPTRPESVTWISGCTDLWMTLWVLVGLTAWDLRPRHGSPGVTAGWPAVVSAGAAFALATYAKESAIVVPFVLVADALLLPMPSADRRRAVKTAGALCVSTVGVFALRFALPAVRTPRVPGDSVGQAVPRVASSLGHYLAMIFWHIPPTVEVAPERYDALGHALFPGWSIVLGAAGVVSFGVLCVVAWRRPAARPWLADTLWCMAPLAPVLNFIPLRLSVLVAPRFLYLPLLGVCAALARGAALAFHAGGRSRTAAGALAAVVITVFGVASLQHVTHLLTDDDLWTYEDSIHPDDLIVIRNLARIRSQQHRFPESYALLRHGIAAARGRTTGPSRPFEIIFAVTLVGEEVIQTPDADQATLTADRVFLDTLAGPPGSVATRDSPHGHVRLALSSAERRWVVHDLADPYRLSRAVVHARTLSFTEAERQLSEMLREEPRSALAWRNLVLVYAAEERWSEALAAAERAANRLPDDTVVPMLRARIERAQRDLATLPQGSPERAEVLAAVFIDLGQRELARRTLAPVIAADPGRPAAVLTLARADETDGLPQAAREVLIRALQTTPSQADTWRAALRALDARHAPHP